MSVENKISKLALLLQIAQAELEEIRMIVHPPKIISKGMNDPEVSNIDTVGLPKKK